MSDQADPPRLSLSSPPGVGCGGGRTSPNLSRLVSVATHLQHLRRGATTLVLYLALSNCNPILPRTTLPIPSTLNSTLAVTSIHRGKSSGAGSSMTNGGDYRDDRSRSNGAGAGDGGRGSGSSAFLFPGDSGLATRLLAGVKAGKGESWARCECSDYTQVCPPPRPPAVVFYSHGASRACAVFLSVSSFACFFSA